jgi:hypothetical protein
LVALREVAETTPSAVIRRMVRRAVTWTADYALSMPLRHEALTLVSALDSRQDDLAELVMPGWHGEPTRRGVPVPTLSDLRAADTAQAEHEAGLTEQELESAKSARISALVDAKQSAHEALVELVVEDLIACGDEKDIVSTVDAVLRQATVALPGQKPSLWDMWRQLGRARSDLLPGIVVAIAAGESGPLDQHLDQVLNVWAEVDETSLLGWLDGLDAQRPGIRLAVGAAFANYGWTDRGPRFVETYMQGTRDPDPDVRDQFHIGSFRILAASPATTASSLVAQNISPFAATRAIVQACSYDGSSWGRQLNSEDAQAVLELARHAAWNEHAVQELVGGIASVHPRLVLDWLVAMHQAGRLPLEIQGLASAFADQADPLVNWLVESSLADESDSAAIVADLILRGGLTPGQAQRLSMAVDAVEGSVLPALVGLLGPAQLWPLHHPELARSFLSKAKLAGKDIAKAVRAEIQSAMNMVTFGWENDGSPELERARGAAAACAEAEKDPDLRAVFEAARARFENDATWIRQQHEQDEDEDEN